MEVMPLPEQGKVARRAYQGHELIVTQQSLHSWHKRRFRQQLVWRAPESHKNLGVFHEIPQMGQGRICLHSIPVMVNTHLEKGPGVSWNHHIGCNRAEFRYGNLPEAKAPRPRLKPPTCSTHFSGCIEPPPVHCAPVPRFHSPCLLPFTLSDPHLGSMTSDIHK